MDLRPITGIKDIQLKTLVQPHLKHRVTAKTINHAQNLGMRTSVQTFTGPQHSRDWSLDSVRGWEFFVGERLVTGTWLYWQPGRDRISTRNLSIIIYCNTWFIVTGGFKLYAIDTKHEQKQSGTRVGRMIQACQITFTGSDQLNGGN